MTLNIQGNANGGLFNFVSVDQTLPISTYNASLCAVIGISNSLGVLQVYRPTSPLNPFTDFIAGSGYVVLAHQNFTINTSTPLPSPTPTSTPTGTATPTPTITPTNGTPTPSGNGIFYPNYNGSGTDVYVTAGYPISAIIFKDATANDYGTVDTFLSAMDTWGLALSGSNFTTRTCGPEVVAGESYVPNPLAGVTNTSLLLTLSTFNDPSSTTLGYAGPFRRRRATEAGTNSYNIPYEGFMVFNVAYLVDDVNTPTPGGRNAFYYTALHEIGHTLGLGTNWHDVNYSGSPEFVYQSFMVGAGDDCVNPIGLGTTGNLFYSANTGVGARASDNSAGPLITYPNGEQEFAGDISQTYAYNPKHLYGYQGTTHAVTAYQQAFGITLTAIPVENGGGGGSFGSHWEEGEGFGDYGHENRNYYGDSTPGAPGLNDELMTPTAEGEYDAPLSEITLGALRDLGYTVNYSVADVYKPLEYNVYANGTTNPLNIGFNGSTNQTRGYTFPDNKGKWITAKRGLTYQFHIHTGANHPIYIVSTDEDTGNPPASRVTTGVTNDGIETGTITWTIPTNLTPNYYYLQCGNHPNMYCLIDVF